MAKKETSVSLRARSVMWGFYSALEDKLKRFQPIDYAPFASLMMRRGLQDHRTGSHFPPFRILHSIEANCAYARGQNKDAIDEYRLGAVMNVWYDNENPLFEEAIKENVQQYFLLMYRQQMESQYQCSRHEAARTQLLFVSDNPMPGVAAEFVDSYGLTIEKWMQLCWLTYAASREQPSGHFLKRAVRDCRGTEFDDGEIDAFFMLVSRTPLQIREWFRREVLASWPELRFLLRSVFLETPVIDFGQAGMLAPHSDLVLRNSGQGAYRLIRPLASFDKEFGDSVQKYVGKVLRSLRGVRLLLEDAEIERLAGGKKSCDYVLEMEDCILLVECKATTFVATGLLEHVILNDGSTGKVADGIVQVYSTAHELSGESFASRGVSRGKPVIGIVATYGEMPLVNSDWYFGSFVLKRAEKDLVLPIYPSTRMEGRPLVLSLDALENLVLVINNGGVSPVSLYAEKQQLPYIRVGDWLAFTDQKLRDLGDRIRPLPFVPAEIDDLFRSMTGSVLPSKDSGRFGETTPGS